MTQTIMHSLHDLPDISFRRTSNISSAFQVLYMSIVLYAPSLALNAGKDTVFYLILMLLLLYGKPASS